MLDRVAKGGGCGSNWGCFSFTLRTQPSVRRMSWLVVLVLPPLQVPTTFGDVVGQLHSRCSLMLALAPATRVLGVGLEEGAAVPGSPSSPDAPQSVSSLFRNAMLYATRSGDAPPSGALLYILVSDVEGSINPSCASSLS